jgi:hypothetical protein
MAIALWVMVIALIVPEMYLMTDLFPNSSEQVVAVKVAIITLQVAHTSPSPKPRADTLATVSM